MLDTRYREGEVPVELYPVSSIKHPVSRIRRDKWLILFWQRSFILSESS